VVDPAAQSELTDMADARAQTPLSFVLMALGIAIAIIVAVTMVYLSQRATAPFDSAKANPVAPPQFGVTGTIRADGATREYRAAALNLHIEPGVVHDPELPDTPFEGEFTLTFDRGRVQYARIGAEIQGGSLIIMRSGEVLLSDYAAPDAAKLALTRIPIELVRRREQITFIFKTESQGPLKLRAMWQPEGADQASALGEAQAERDG
jgi:hypothetical protein